MDLLVLESFPVHVSAIAGVHLRDGCTAIDELTGAIVADENTFCLEITTMRDPDTTCM